MKIAIASEGKNERDQVSEVYGRADYFLIFENKKLIKTIKNPFKMGGGGAGFGVTQMLFKEKVELVIAGSFGEKVINFLKEKNIKTKVVINKKVNEII
jgi:predicted Fe-Mo cluster-binding NifX family protein